MGLFLFLALLAVGAAPAAAHASSLNWGSGVRAELPAGAAAEPRVVLTSISCAGAGDCGAVGYYTDGAGVQQGLLLTESSGAWSPGLKATLPADAGAYALVSLNSVSCASPGNCSAVGDYRDGAGDYQGLVISQSSGVWGPGVKATPADAGPNSYITLSAVSCGAPGSCGAVGQYIDGSDHQQGVFVTQSLGVWNAGVKTAVPADAGSNPRVRFYSVSCDLPGSCAAVGAYEDSDGYGQGLLVTAAPEGGSQAAEATLPGNAESEPAAEVRSVSCPSSGNCSAVGDYRAVSGQAVQGLLLVESSGVWRPGVEATLPPDAGPDPRALLESVSCAAAGECSAVGGYTDAAGYYRGVLLGESGGAWGSGIEAALPADASAAPNALLYSVSCASAGDCGAAGDYVDGGGNGQGLLQSESSALWGGGVRATLPADAGTVSRVVLYSVSCPSPEACGAVGFYSDVSGHQQGLLQGSPTASEEGAGGGSDGAAGGGSGAGPGVSGAPGGPARRSVPTLGKPKVDGTSVSVPIHCSGAGGSSCAVRLTISAPASPRGKGVAASSSAVPKKGSQTVLLGSRSVTIAAGRTDTVKISLNGRGKKLLARRGRLKARLTLLEAAHPVSATRVAYRAHIRAHRRRR